MFSFPQTLKVLGDEGFLDAVPRQPLVDAPLYIHHHGDREISMPSREDWQRFKELEEFQRILPSPITKTIQTSNGLRGFRVYSILISDGGKLVTKKILASDTSLLLILQVFDIDQVLDCVTQEGQPLDVWNKCFSVRPSCRAVSEFQAPMPAMAKMLSITTMHFIYSIHLEKELYKQG